MGAKTKIGTPEPVYFDNNATTPLDPRVREAMLPWLGPLHGNPSSAHGFGRAARLAVDEARERVAALLGGRPEEIVFTASGSEANNMALFDAARRAGFRGHLVVSAFEHPSVLAAADVLEERGMAVSRVPPEPDGAVPAEAVEGALRPETVLVCLMLANNELGTVQPVAQVAAACRGRGIPLLTDAVQAVGKMPVDAPALGASYLTLGGHKFHAPPGSAALWVHPEAPMASLVVGAPQENGRRAGTENVPAVVGLGEACALAAKELPERIANLAALRDRFEEGLGAISAVRLHCREAPRLPHTSNVAFPGVLGRDLVLRLDEAGFAVSTGAACAAGKTASPTLLAMGLPEEEASACLRVSFGIENRADEVDRFLAVLGPLVEEMRSESTQAHEPGAPLG